MKELNMASPKVQSDDFHGDHLHGSDLVPISNGFPLNEFPALRDYKVWSKTESFRLGGFATGEYTCKCKLCDADYMGDKRSYICFDCAVELANKWESEIKSHIRYRSPSKNMISLDEPEKQKVTVTIIGQANSGKSRIAYMIKNMLKLCGLKVNQIEDPDFETEAEFDECMAKNTFDCIKNIKDKTEIDFYIIQNNRTGF